jgi:hypothetical protein
MYGTLFKTASSAALQVPNVTKDAGLEPRTVATFALAVRQNAPTTLLDRIYSTINTASFFYDVNYRLLIISPGSYCLASTHDNGIL